jgi:hypothetical protein
MSVMALLQTGARKPFGLKKNKKQKQIETKNNYNLEHPLRVSADLRVAGTCLYGLKQRL